MAERTITIQLAGLPDDDGSVRADALAAELNAIVDALAHTESLLLDESQKRSRCVITQLSLNSPVRIGCTLLDGEHAEDTISNFMRNIDSIQNQNHIPEEFDMEMAQIYMRVGENYGTTLTEIGIRNGHGEVRLNEFFTVTLKNAITSHKARLACSAFGSVKGRLEQANVHGKLRCWIYPFIGPSSIRCTFGSDLLPDIEKAFNKKVIVHGLMHYKPCREFAEEMEIFKVEILPEDDHLATMDDVRGAVSD